MNRQAKIKGPLATQGNVNNVNWRANIIIVLAVIIIILLLFLIWPWVVGNNLENSIEGEICPPSTSILCDDFNPCTLDLITPICGNITNNGGGTSCQSFQCQNIPLSNGSCCSAEDVCYYDDPNKACVFGTCKSPDPTLCKGYCIGDDASTCPPLPFNIDTNVTTPIVSCMYNSCVTLFQFNSPIAVATSILDTSDATDITNLNIEACLESSCVVGRNGFLPFPEVQSICIFKWKCAPYIKIETFLKKRTNEEDKYNNDDDDDDKNQKNIFKFPIYGVDYNFYKKINNKINKMINNDKYPNFYNINRTNKNEIVDFKLNNIYKFTKKSIVSN